MALNSFAGLIHLPFGERPQYGSPYPEGLAVAHFDQADDASGGTHTFSLLADGGFIYRMELWSYARGTESATLAHCITSHRWASDKSGLGASSFDLNWLCVTSVLTGSGFRVYGLHAESSASSPDAVQMIRRFPMGTLQNVQQQLIYFQTNLIQIDGVTNELSLVFTYWRKESLFRPGFLSSFYDSPVVPTPLKIGA